MLKQRILTAIILIPIVIFGIFSTSEIFGILCGIFIVLAAWEWGRIMTNYELRMSNEEIVPIPSPRSTIPLFYALFITLILLSSYWLITSFLQSIFVILLIACVFWLTALYWAISYQHGTDFLPSSKVAKAILGVFILIPAWSALFLLHKYYGEQFVIFLLVLIWAADTGAYFSGKRWGHRKLADKISPGKTIEGIMGEIALGVSISIGYGFFIALTDLKINTDSLSKFLIALFIFTLLCLITVCASVLGDLLESLFKRQVGIKDSSQILPGHGGVLDRIDSLTAAAPIFTLGIILLDNRL